MKDTKNISLGSHDLIKHGITISIISYEDAYAFSHSILETINQVLVLSDVSDIPPEDIYNSIRTQIRILQSINLESIIDINK